MDVSAEFALSRVNTSTVSKAIPSINFFEVMPEFRTNLLVLSSSTPIRRCSADRQFEKMINWPVLHDWRAPATQL